MSEGFYHCSVKSVGRAKGRSVVAAAAYRSGERLLDQRTGEVFDYRARGGVAETFVLSADNAPDWTQNRGQLWSRAELAEGRANGRLATELELALPHELTVEQRRQLLSDFLKPIIERHGTIADVAIHEPGKEKDHRNIHAHVLLTHRMLDADGFVEKVKGQRKDTGLSTFAMGSEAVIEIRKDWEQHVNRAYELAGLDVRVDHRSHSERGIEQEPTKHLGPKANAMEQREPGSSDRGAINREIEERNAALRERAALEIAATKAEAELAAARQLEELERRFASASTRTTEPPTPVWDRDAETRAADERIADAAISRDEEQERQRPSRPTAAEREKARPPSWIESRIADAAGQAARLGATVLEDANGQRVDRVEALADYFRAEGERQTHTVTVQGRDAFEARLEEAGIAFARVTEADATALAALREQEGFDRASGLAHKPRHFAALLPGDLAAVTRQGDVHRINPDKFWDAKRFLDLTAELPGVIETRARFEIEGQKISALWDQQHVTAAEARQDYAAERESQAQHAQTVRDVHQVNHETGEAVDTGVRATRSILGSLGNAIASFISGIADSFAPPPPPTPEQAKDMARAAAEQHEARAEQTAEAQREDQHWLIIEAQKQAREREEAEAEQESARRRTEDRGYERER